MILAEKHSEFQPNSRVLQDEVRRLRVKSENVMPTAVNWLPEVTIRRELKICGHTGEGGTKGHTQI